MPHKIALFCLACGVDLPDPLRRTASLRCHACRDEGAPISFELALRANELCRTQSSRMLDEALSARREAA